MPMEILFPASVKNDTEQIFVTCAELNNKNGWEHIKGKSIWVNVNFDSLEEVKNQIILVFHSKQLY